MVNLKPHSKIYVACPPNSATGGPELLHQLVYKLNERGIDAQIFYYPPGFNGNPIHPNYREYVDTWAEKVDDHPDNMLIVPETRTFILSEYSKIQKVIWWLSVDNYKDRVKGKKNSLRRFFRVNRFFNVRNKSEHKNIGLHFVQSKYAEVFLQNHGITNIAHLSDYLRKDFIEGAKKINIAQKKDWVLYNPKKGLEFTQKLIDAYPDIQWKPIIDLTPDEVKNLIAESKVYIDFGRHPGKDRLPRECAVLNCCIITNKEGSAFFQEDVPIPEVYKFDHPRAKLQDIYVKLKSCLENYEQEIANFQTYRDIIHKQEAVFDDEISKIFKLNAPSFKK